jgi:hypothetical protein
MLIKSQAGEFEINVSGFEIDGDDLVMIGAMGVWQARTYVAPKEAIGLMGKLICSSAVWKYILMLPFTLIKRRSTQNELPKMGKH